MGRIPILILVVAPAVSPAVPSPPKLQAAAQTDHLQPVGRFLSFSAGSVLSLHLSTRGNGNQMVRHKAPTHKCDAKPSRLLCQKLQITETIPIVRKDFHRTDAALGNVMVIAWHNQT
jgi:hypothetical protein